MSVAVDSHGRPMSMREAAGCVRSLDAAVPRRWRGDVLMGERGACSSSAQISVYGPALVRVTASEFGGRGDLPHVAVTVGDCLTYVYDRDALVAHVSAWREAARVNEALRLPVVLVTGARPEPHQGADVVFVCSAVGEQHYAVSIEGRAVLKVVVGAVTVRVHSSTALRCCLLAWERAAAMAVFRDES